jgi:hypothetical protein
VQHPIPEAGDLTGCGCTNILADTAGRLWIGISENGEPVQVFDTQTGRWLNFASPGDAYLGVRDNPPHFLANDLYVISPEYSLDRRRIAFRVNSIEITYYDGLAWQRFRTPQITGRKGNDAVGPPWFDPAGNLCVNLDKTWRMNSEGHWVETAFESHFPTDLSEKVPGPTSIPKPPEACVTSHPDSIVVDNLGTSWLTWRSALYKSIPGHCIQVFGPDDVSPFHSPDRSLRNVFVDPRGNAFVLTSAESWDAYIIKPRAALPRTTIELEPIRADAVSVRLHSDSTLPVQFRWRLDHQPWQTTDESPLLLDDLPAGAHRLMVSALDADLQQDPAPPVSTFETVIDPARQIEALIARLSDPDYARRKSAMHALAAQPALALSALRQARKTADEDKRWWIDATLQNIETEKRAVPPQPPGSSTP